MMKAAIITASIIITAGTTGPAKASYNDPVLTQICEDINYESPVCEKIADARLEAMEDYWVKMTANVTTAEGYNRVHELCDFKYGNKLCDVFDRKNPY